MWPQVLQSAPAAAPWILALIAFGGMLATLIKAWSVLRKVELEAGNAKASIELEGEAALWAEIHKLRVEVSTERKTCDERIERIDQRHKDDVAKLESEMRVLRHDRNNVRQALNAMLAMLKREGADVTEVVATIEDMLQRGDEVIALEKGAIGR